MKLVQPSESGKDGPPCILDSDLAELLGRKTKRINEAAARSIYIDSRATIRYQLRSGEWKRLRRTRLKCRANRKASFRPNKALPWVYTFDGACLVMSRMRVDLSDEKKHALLSLFGMDTLPLIDYGEARPEERITAGIQEALKGIVTMERHFPVRTEKGRFLIDLYLSEWNLAVEVDEPGHRGKAMKDAERERVIRAKIGCEFVRCSSTNGIIRCLNQLLKRAAMLR